jgi:hypothetical protein
MGHDREPDAWRRVKAVRATREAIDRERAGAGPRCNRFSHLPSAKSPPTVSRE